MAIELKIPSAGESVTEVVIGGWRKKVGEAVARDEVLVEIETDKASMDVTAPQAGVLKAIQRQAGEKATVGETIAIIDESAQVAAPDKAARGARVEARSEAPAAGAASRPAAQTATARAGETRVMPAAQRALAEHGLRADQVAATGPGGRLLKEDVLRHVEGGAPGSAPATTGGNGSPSPAAPAGDRHEEAVPMTMLRRTIAQRLVESQQTMAMLTTFNEIDMSAVMQLRTEQGDAFQKRYNVKLGFMSFFVKAAIDGLRRIPSVNAEVRVQPGPDGTAVPHIVYKNYFDVGVAVSTDRGLVVPVIRGAERMSFAEIEIAIGELSARARDRKLTIEELQGGTFTISNGGVFGSLMSTPIINPPQSAILGLHAIQERPVARGGQIVIRPMMYVALTYDHRIIDGRESVTFLKRIKECIEDPTRMLVEV